MCEPLTIAAVVGGTTALASGGLQAAGAVQRGKAEQQIARHQAAQMEAQAADAERRGLSQASQIQSAGRAAGSTAVAGLAASGIESTSGSAAGLIQRNAMITELDAQTARSNAAREAWGLRSGADDAITQGRLAKRSSFLTAAGATLGAAGAATKSFGKLL